MAAPMHRRIGPGPAPVRRRRIGITPAVLKDWIVWTHAATVFPA